MIWFVICPSLLARHGLGGFSPPQTEFSGATENARVEKSGADCRGGKCTSAICSRIFHTCIFHSRIFSARNLAPKLAWAHLEVGALGNEKQLCASYLDLKTDYRPRPLNAVYFSTLGLYGKTPSKPNFLPTSCLWAINYLLSCLLKEKKMIINIGVF